MSIREAIPSDFQAIGKVCTAAFMDEELYGGLKHPHRREYPEDFETYFVHKIYKNWLDSTRTILVAIDDESGKVVGMADWQRSGVNLPPNFQEDDPRHSSNPAHAEFKNRASTFNNRAAGSNISKHTILEESFPLVAHFWSGPREENWTLDLLAVDPSFEGRGHGKRLTQWGIDKARTEGITTSVVSADQKDKFYERLGFKKVGMANVGPLAENGMKGGVVMFIDI